MKILDFLFSLIILFGLVESYQSHRDRGDKTAGVNGGTVFFDEESGEFRRFPDNVAAVEVIKRTPIRTLNSGGVVNKVLKRRKKYRRLPLRRSDASKQEEDDNDNDRPQAREINDSFEKLPPLRAKYKTSDSIRMHLRPRSENNLISSSSSKSSNRLENNRSNQGKIKSTNYNQRKRPEPKQKIELSDKFKFKQKLLKQSRVVPEEYFEQLGAESREEKVYQKYEDDVLDDGDVLVASGYHNSFTIQEPLQNTVSQQDPAYDFTIGNKNNWTNLPATVYHIHVTLIINNFR